MTNTEAMKLADALTRAIQQADAEDSVIDVARWFVEDSAAELRRLDEVEKAYNLLLERTYAAKEQTRGYILAKQLTSFWTPENMDVLLEAGIALRVQERVIQQLLDALDAMLTHMGMDEDSWNKPTFDQARAAIAAAKGEA
jgi:hypothetical protein